MKRNTFNIDKRAEWKIRKVIFQNRLSENEIDELLNYGAANETKKVSGKFALSNPPFLPIFRYFFN